MGMHEAVRTCFADHVAASGRPRRPGAAGAMPRRGRVMRPPRPAAAFPRLHALGRGARRIPAPAGAVGARGRAAAAGVHGLAVLIVNIVIVARLASPRRPGDNRCGPAPSAA